MAAVDESFQPRRFSDDDFDLNFQKSSIDGEHFVPIPFDNNSGVRQSGLSTS